MFSVMAENGLQRGEKGTSGLWHVREFPLTSSGPGSSRAASMASRSAAIHLTQRKLGVDRNSEALAELFDEQDEADK